MTDHQATFLFYDIETTGLNACFDQVLQFAAVRTDLDLNELERHEFMISLNPDTVMSPESLITHRISIQQTLNGETEYLAIKKIHQLLNTPGTISLGYNTLNFDDEFLRFAFFRNLLPPYTHQFANQCSRMDLYPITILYYLHKRESLNWPMHNKKISLKLENLATANNLSSGPAHNAMVDVIATVNLAKRFQQFPDMWKYSQGYFSKHIDSLRQEKIPSQLTIANQFFKTAIMIKGNFGSRCCYQAPVIKLGQHLHYKNQTIWLRLDNENLANTSLASIAQTTTIIRKKAGEQEIILPLTERYCSYLSSERKNWLIKNQTWLQENPDLLQAICEYHLNYQYPIQPNVDIDAALYQMNFPSLQLESLFKQFHGLNSAEKLSSITWFPDSMRQQQALRLLARNFLTEFSAEQQLSLQASLQSYENATDFRGQVKLTHEQALQQTQKLLTTATLDEQQKQLLTDYQHYLQEKVSASTLVQNELLTSAT